MLIIPQTSNAWHLVGGEMYYECLGNNQYKIFMKVYRDCNTQQGANFDNPALLSVFDGLGNSVSGINNPVSVPIAIGPTNIPVTTGNPCVTPPPGLCVEEAIYELTLTLPYNPNGYHISYSRCCRNTSITNIFNPNDYGGTFTTFISDLAQTSCNNGAKYNNFPPIIICVGQPLNVDHSASDVEGDSLVYSFCAPFQGLTSQNPAGPADPPPYSTVPFIPPLSATNPLGGSPQITINPQTGLITGIPIQQGQFVVGVCVEEYRNGVLLSTLKRDFQFNATSCAVNVQADILENYKTGFREYVIENCGDTIIDIINQSNQSQFISGYSWNFDLNDGTMFNSTVSSPTINFPGYDTYQGMLVVNPGSTGCTDTAFVEVIIHSPPNADFSFTYDSCIIGPVSFFDSSTPGNPNDTLSYYLWDFDDGVGFADTLDPIYQYLDAGSFNVKLTVIDENNCVDSLVTNLVWAPTPIIDVFPTSFIGCAPGDIEFINNSYPINGYTTTWDLGDGNFSNDASPIHTYNDPGVYTVSVFIESPLNCQATDTFSNLITIYEAPLANAIAEFDSCVIGPIGYTSLSTPGDTSIRRWTWDLADGNIATDTNVIYQYLLAGSYNVGLFVEDFNGCTDTFYQVIDWFPAPVLLIGQPVYEGCSPYTVTIENNSYPINGYTTLWALGDGDSSLAPSPTHTYEDIGSYDLTLTVTSPTGCIESQVFDGLVVVNPNPVADFIYSPDPPSNVNPTLDFINRSIDAIAWQWNFDDQATSLDQNPTHTFVDTGTTVVTLIATHITGCQDTLTKIIDIVPKYSFYLPNAFTPNEDDVNDGFRGTGLFWSFQEYDMKIWNRWGELIFQTSDPEEAWNGRKNNNGEMVKNGVYVCKVRLVGPRGKEQFHDTTVSVIR
jgi:gliding motility-associated-like protein